MARAAAKRIPEGEAMCRQGKFTGWQPDMLLGLELKGRHAVLVGKGYDEGGAFVFAFAIIFTTPVLTPPHATALGPGPVSDRSTPARGVVLQRDLEDRPRPGGSAP